MPGNILQRLAFVEKALEILKSRPFVLYDKGTFVPTYFGQATAGVTTYTLQDGFWTRIGRLVFYNGRVTWTNATGTGNSALGGLPFTAPTPPAGTGRWLTTLWASSVTFGAFPPVGLLTQGNAFTVPFTFANNAAATQIAIEVAGDYIFHGWFWATN